MSLEDQVLAFLKDKKWSKDHLNFVQQVPFIKISTGSLIMDQALRGGMSHGIHRFSGVSTGGKTSEILECCKSFLKEFPKRKVFWFKCEGRLDPAMLNRCGVIKPKDFEVQDKATLKRLGEITTNNVGEKYYDLTGEERLKMDFVIMDTNVYNFIASFIESLIKNNPEGYRFFCVIDSVDGVVIREDLDKSYDDAPKVAGASVISSLLMKRISLLVDKYGHFIALISQVRSTIRGQYEKAEPSLAGSTGGHALNHYPNTYWDFQKRYQKDKILDAAGNVIGHYAKVRMAKTGTEKDDMEFQYPVKYGRNGESSIWREKEIVDMLVSWEFLKKKGAWFAFDEDFMPMFKEESGIQLPDKQFQGLNAVFKYVEDNKDVCDALYEKFRKM